MGLTAGAGADEASQLLLTGPRTLRGLLADGVLVASGPCLGQVNTGIAIFEAPDEQTARRIVAGEPVTSGGYMR